MTVADPPDTSRQGPAVDRVAASMAPSSGATVGMATDSKSPRQWGAVSRRLTWLLLAIGGLAFLWRGSVTMWLVIPTPREAAVRQIWANQYDSDRLPVLGTLDLTRALLTIAISVFVIGVLTAFWQLLCLTDERPPETASGARDAAPESPGIPVA